MSLSRKNSTDLFDDLAAAFETDKKETVVASTTAEPSAAQQVADLLNDLAKSGDINSDATSESHSSSEADSTNEKASENEDQTEESSLSEKSAKRIARSTKK